MQGDWSTSIIILSVFYALSWPTHSVREYKPAEISPKKQHFDLRGWKKGNSHSNYLATLVPDSHCGRC